MSRYSLLLRGSASIAGIPRKDSLARQAARVRVPVVRNLWRSERLLGLRSARRRTAAQPEGRLVARHDLAWRHRRPRRLDPHAPARLGSLRSRAEFLRSDGRLPRMQIAL